MPGNREEAGSSGEMAVVIKGESCPDRHEDGGGRINGDLIGGGYGFRDMEKGGGENEEPKRDINADGLSSNAL